ncbi:probable G-protein coupled receptor No18 [Uranotaenia lowii]|uniref:probable G-protein coupled receptor No18 n=1 Tax=Uranotaenia lowii TaxID=190385 RepID=UPI0024796831|nr:probable G-protein coupled receptor No18 [Uranotaenia lowii]XP_055596782.1 probable G-protein coupled receptor No18 [Uranotaenia lowii]XP_055596856.1 probable G-protein coupled receptor No18 [Uranotaenia lowii]
MMYDTANATTTALVESTPTKTTITINYPAASSAAIASKLCREIYVNLQIVQGDLLNFSERFILRSNGSQLELSTVDGGVGGANGGGGGASESGSGSGNDAWGCAKICLSWEKLLLVVLFCTLIVITIIGNTLVILSVATTRRLRTVTNCFVMSLAVADWLVGIFVMPPAVMLFVVDKWQLGSILCDIWISLDVLLCTASILSLCAISVDRYLAVTQPLTYSKRRRSKRLALLMIFIVWLVALAITCPPFLGWYDQQGRERNECQYNQNKGYVVFSAMGSFFIPMSVMLYVYSKICCVLTSRQHRMTKTEAKEKNCEVDIDNVTSEVETSPKQGGAGYLGRNISSSYGNSHQTLYEFLSSARTTPSSTRHAQLMTRVGSASVVSSGNSLGIGAMANSISNNNTSSGGGSGSGGPSLTPKYSQNYEMRPINSVQFSASQLSLTESCVSNVTTNTTTKIRLHGKRIPIRISSLKRETKTAQTLSMVVGGFIACWLPFFIYYLLMPFLPEASQSKPLMAFLTWLGWINSAINPFIYAFYNVDFRIAFWRLTFRKFYKNKHNLAFFRS